YEMIWGLEFRRVLFRSDLGGRPAPAAPEEHRPRPAAEPGRGGGGRGDPAALSSGPGGRAAGRDLRAAPALAAGAGGDRRVHRGRSEERRVGTGGGGRGP